MQVNEWLSERKKGIGGTDISAIIGINPYKSPLDVYNDKLDLVVEDSDNIHTKIGRTLEPIIAQEFATRNNVDVVIPEQQIYYDEHNPLFRGSIDRFYNDNGKRSILEIKHTSKVTTEINPVHFCQVQWYLGVTGLDNATICYMNNFKDLSNFPIDKDIEFIEYLRNEGLKFWENHILTQTPPEATNLKDLKQLYPKSNEFEVIADNAVFDAYINLKSINSQIKDLEKEKEALEYAIKFAFKDAEAISYGGKTIATYKTQISSRLDNDLLIANIPNLNDYKKMTTTRVLRLK